MPEVKNCLTCQHASKVHSDVIRCNSPLHPVKWDMIHIIGGRLTHNHCSKHNDFLYLDTCPAHKPKE